MVELQGFQLHELFLHQKIVCSRYYSIIPCSSFSKPNHFVYWFQIRTLGMLRSRFESLPGAFNACLIPEEKSEPRKKGLKATLSRRFDQVNCFRLFCHLILGLVIIKSIITSNLLFSCRYRSHLIKVKKLQDLHNYGTKLSLVLEKKILSVIGNLQGTFMFLVLDHFSFGTR